jgi:hypothetical protein
MVWQNMQLRNLSSLIMRINRFVDLWAFSALACGIGYMGWIFSSNCSLQGANLGRLSTAP